MADTAHASEAQAQATAREPDAGDIVFLVDGSSFVFRAYFQSMNQDRKYNYRSDGLPTGAVRLFCNKLFQFLREGAADLQPTHLAIIFDKSEDTFRKEIYPAYKSNRSEPPDDLIPQFPLMRAAVEAFGLTPIELAGFEADDLIATYARQAKDAGATVLIISADKDLMQLVGPQVSMYDPASGEGRRPGQGKMGVRAERRIGTEEVLDYFGVPPDKVIDVQALAGDSTDNVPGVPGIGRKTAAQLIAEYGDLDTLLANAGTIKQPKRRENLTTFADQARISRRLVTLDDHVAVTVPLAELALHQPEPRRLIGFFKAMDFTTLARRAGEEFGADHTAVGPDERYMRLAEIAPGAAPTDEPADAFDGTEPLTPAALALSLEQKALADTAIHPPSYETVTSADALTQWMQAARGSGTLAIAVRLTADTIMAGSLCGIGIAVAPGRAAYVPLILESDEPLLAEAGGAAMATIAQQDLVAIMGPVLADPSVLKISCLIKREILALLRLGLEVRGFDDCGLLSYAADSGAGAHDVAALAKRWLNHTPLDLRDIAGTGRARLTFGQIPVEKATMHAGEEADVALRLWPVLRQRAIAKRVQTVYETLERPLAPVLARMEQRGVVVDRAVLSRMSGDFAQTLERIETEIYDLAGERFNVGSPKQLGDILFGKLGLSGARKTKTGAWQTGAQVLEELAAEGHPLPVKCLEWRQISKLKSTYTDALQGEINPETGRVHTTFMLASTTTGRLSSTDPNLQNIPVRSEEGRKIRAAFVAAPGTKLLSADYSQIELRVLAHIADIPQLTQAFADGLDIHAMTASEMFGLPVEGMDPMVRRRAKAINFGIIYGISAFGLANQLGIPRDEAGAYIRRYFERFPGIRDYMDAIKAFVRTHGYVTTLFGRRAHYPEIDTKNPSMRAFYERAAINAPIQGSAADIIRRAMIQIEPRLAAEGLGARMLLQVHDELLFEVPDEEVDATIPLIRDVMRLAALPAVQLKVPLEVEARAADSWAAAH